MQATNVIWRNGQFMPWENAQTHVLSHGLHYGSGVFEGIRFYESKNGPVIFKLPEHIHRLFYSAKQIGMKIPFSEAELTQAVIDTVKRNRISSGYIRPLCYYGYGPLKVVPDESLPVDTIIACWPWGAYLEQKAVDIKTSQYIRIHPDSTVADAKICGHYINSILAGLEIKNTHYHEALLLDMDGYVAEGSAENIFIIKDNEIKTPPTGTILEGITRNVVMEIAREFDIPISEAPFKPEDVIEADEAFFSGTAVEITAIRSLDDKIIGNGEIGPMTKKIQDYYHQIVRDEIANFKEAVTRVPEMKEAVA